MKRPLRARAVGLGLLAGSVALFVAPAAATGTQTPTNVPVAVRKVDSTDTKNVTVTFTCECSASDAGKTKVTENGNAVDVSTPAKVSDLGGSATILVIDASATTSTGALDDFKAAAKAVVADRAGNDLIGVVSTARLAATRARLTNDAGVLNAAIDGIEANNEGGLYSGVARAVDLLEDRPSAIPNILVMTDGNPGVTLPSDVRAAVLASGATVYIYAVNTGDLVAADVETLTSETRGRNVITQGVVDGAGGPVEQFANSIASAYQLSFPSDADRGVNNITLSVGSDSTDASYVSGSVQVGAAALKLQTTVGPGGISFLRWLRGDTGKAIGIVGGIVAAALIAYAAAQLMVKDKSTLSHVLQPYDGYSQDEPEAEPQGAVQTAFIQRAVAFTSSIAERQGFLTKVETALERADLPLRAAEALFFYAAGAALFTLLVIVVAQSALITLFGLILVLLMPPAILNYLANRRHKKFNSQLPDTLQLLSGTLRAGYSMMQGVEAVSQEVEDPMGRELRRVVTESRLGRPLEESLDASAERMASPDFAWAVMAIRIQREVGGNLSELLLTVAETMTQRERLRRDISALTAEGRVSAVVLAILPVAIGFIMYTINPDYMRVLFDESIGKAMVGGAVLLALAGFWWMKKFIEIEV